MTRPYTEYVSMRPIVFHQNVWGVQTSGMHENSAVTRRVERRRAKAASSVMDSGRPNHVAIEIHSSRDPRGSG